MENQQQNTSNGLIVEYAKVDSVYRTTATLGNLTSIAAIMTIPGFGANALSISNSIQFSIAAILEIPTGALADKFGSAKFALLGFYLKLGVTTLFLGAALLALTRELKYLWWVFAAEAIVDAFASSLINGAYQVSFYKWLKLKLAQFHFNNEEEKTFFLKAQHEALLFRLVVPILFFTLVFGVGSLFKLDIEVLSIASVCLVIIFRISVIMLLRAKLKAVATEETEISRFGKLKIAKMIAEVPKYLIKREYWHLLFGNYLAIFSTFFIVPNIIKSSNQYSDHKNYGWIVGVSLMFGVSMARVLLNYSIMKRFAARVSHSSIKLFSFYSLLMTLSLFQTNDFDVIGRCIIYFISAIINLLVSDVLINFYIGRLAELNILYKTLWFSTVSSGAYFIFTMSSIYSSIYSLHGSQSGKYTLIIYSLPLLLLALINIVLRGKPADA